MTYAEQLTRLLGVLEPVRDIVDGAVESAEPPAWCERRGWVEFLLTLDARHLDRAEREGLAACAALPEFSAAPPSLRELAEAVRVHTLLPELAAPEVQLSREALRGVRTRKGEQLAALLGALSPLAQEAKRIVDVGAGSGHLSRLAAELFGRDTWAVDRDAARLRSASQRAEQRARSVGTLPVQFVQANIGPQGLELRSNDLAVGLHACGELGDRLVSASGKAGCDLALVSCCLQKTSAEQRVALSRAGAGFELRRSVLGLTNLTARGEGVEASLKENLAARETRLGLLYLLRGRGLRLDPGQEMRGINRRRAHTGLAELAAQALVLHGLPAASASELQSYAERAGQDYARMRRFNLPRSLLARLVELAVVLDRATALEEQGLNVRLARLFEQKLTPRNTVLFASQHPLRLPRLHEP